MKLDWKKKTYFVGAGLGFLSGLIIAVLMVRKAETEDKPLSLSASDGARYGLAIYDLIKKTI